MQTGYFGDAGGPLEGAGIHGGGVKWSAHPYVNANALNSHAKVQYDAAIKAASIEALPSSEIEDRLSRAGSALGRLSNRIDVLGERLRPLMRATGSGSAGAACAPQEALSPLGDSIRSIENRIDNACELLESLLAGLAL